MSDVPSDNYPPRCEQCGAEHEHLEPDECDSCHAAKWLCSLCQHVDPFTERGMCLACRKETKS